MDPAVEASIRQDIEIHRANASRRKDPASCFFDLLLSHSEELKPGSVSDRFLLELWDTVQRKVLSLLDSDDR
jgi:hypothetical protein